MSKSRIVDFAWPPRCWQSLKNIRNLSGQAIVKNPASAQVYGLSYLIEPIPVRRHDGISEYIYHFHIEGWEYSIQNESREFPVMSFLLSEKTSMGFINSPLLSDIKIFSRKIQTNKQLAKRTMLAAYFIMKQISNGIVPDVDRALKLYKMHPLQKSHDKIMASQKCYVIDDCLSYNTKENKA